MNDHPKRSWHTPRYLLFNVCLIIIIGIILHVPLVDYLGSLSTGDSGRDLYAAQEALKGKIPYRDFSWAYGPLTPYYVAIFYKLFGIDIQSLIMARLTARVITGIFFYLAAVTILPRTLSFVSVLWFWSFYSDFSHTVNHTLGLSVMMMSCCALMYYRKYLKIKYLWLGLIPIFLLTLIKLNFGLVSLFALIAGAILIDVFQSQTVTRSKKIFYAAAFFAVPLGCTFVYWLLLHPLPEYERQQALPYGNKFLLQAIPWWTEGMSYYFSKIYYNFINFQWNTIFAVIILAAVINIIRLWITDRLSKVQKKEFLLIAFLLIIFFLAGMHEYIKNGNDYRRYWAKPFTVLLFFFLIQTALLQASQFTRQMVIFIILLTILKGQFSFNLNLLIFKSPKYYLALPHAEIYTYNDHDWKDTVRKTTDYLQKNLRPDELFLAIPHDALYYFLMGRQSPTRHLSFFENLHIAPQQEQDVIQSLEQHHVRFIVLSNSSISNEAGMGNFGEDYCPLLKNYMDVNFEPVAEFGDWTKASRWSWNHATRIYKRKSSL